MRSRCYQDLKVWQDAMELATECYKATSLFPRQERYGMSDQIRRSAVSIAANIAEGQGRRYPRDFARCLRVAAGSLCELETHVELSHRLRYLEEGEVAQLKTRMEAVGKMLNGLIASLDARAP
jgi:four helix bundle protein